jgi:hypothetical protein
MSMKNYFRHTTRIFWRIFYITSLALVDTWQEAFVNKPTQNMNPYVRWELFITGILFLAVVLSTDTQLHWLVLLPLLSIYLISTAVIGYEPIYFLMQRIGAYLRKHWLHLKRQFVTDTHTAIFR